MKNLALSAMLGMALVCATNTHIAADIQRATMPVLPSTVAPSFPECWFFPWLPWCRLPEPPRPIVKPPDPPTDDIYGPY